MAVRQTRRHLLRGGVLRRAMSVSQGASTSKAGSSSSSPGSAAELKWHIIEPWTQQHSFTVGDRTILKSGDSLDSQSDE